MKKRMLLSPPELESLVRRVRDGRGSGASNAAFDRIVEALQDFVVGTAHGYLRDFGLARDASQEAFLIAWRQIHRLKDPVLFLPWLKRIVASQCHRVLRKKQIGVAELSDKPDPSAFEDLVAQKERNQFLREALDQLPERERVVTSLFYFSGSNQHAIAKFLGIPRTTVVKRLFAARQRLKAALELFCAAADQARPSRTEAFVNMVRAGIYSDCVGLYRFDGRPDLTVRLERVGNRLVSHSAGQRNTIMLGSRLSELRTAEFDGRARFVRSKTGQVTHFIYYEFGRRMGIARKVGEPTPARSGRTHQVEAGVAGKASRKARRASRFR